MSHYYFHLDTGIEVTDQEGVELPNLAAARREALRIIGEMFMHFGDQIQTGKQCCLLVEDHQNSAVLRVKVKLLFEDLSCNLQSVMR